MVGFYMEHTTGYVVQSLGDLAENYIKDAILSGRIKSGEKIVESEISQALQISRAPVREALRVLSIQGLLVFSPRRGHRVPALTKEQVQELFQLRLLLELQLVSRLIEKQLLTQEDFDLLTELTEKMENFDQTDPKQADNLFQLNSLDIQFHRLLWNKAESPRCAQLLESMFFELLIVMNNNLDSLGHFREKAQEHKRLIYALQSGDYAIAKQELTNHVQEYVLSTLG